MLEQSQILKDPAMRTSSRIPAHAAAIGLAAMLLVFVPQQLQASCTLNPQNQTVTICSPANGASVTSPVNVVAGTTDSNKVTLLQIYVDGVKGYEVASNQLNTNVTMTNGTHRLTVQAQDSTKAIFKSTISITVGSGGGGGGSLSQIKHIIFMVEENRSFDSYFGMLGAYRQNEGYGGSFNGVPLNASLPDYKGTANASPFHYQTVCTDNMTPSWNESHYSWHGGKMDYFMKTEGSLPSSIDPEGTRMMGYYDQTDIPYYYELAAQYGTSDTWHTPILSDTIPNRMYLLTGTSFGHIRPQDVPPSGGWPQPTIFRDLSTHGVSWRYYYQDSSVYLASFSDWNTYKGNVYNISHYYTDLQSNSLPEVIFIERASQSGLDEHPLNNIQKGAADVSNIINAFLQSPNYKDSVFILTYDDPGGLYDHVPPFSEPAPDAIPPMLRSTDIKGDFTVVWLPGSGHRDLAVDQASLRVARESRLHRDAEVHRDPVQSSGTDGTRRRPGRHDGVLRLLQFADPDAACVAGTADERGL